jgi:hypothetical protein
MRMMLLEITDMILRRKNFEGVTAFMRMRKPEWYEK